MKYSEFAKLKVGSILKVISSSSFVMILKRYDSSSFTCLVLLDGRFGYKIGSTDWLASNAENYELIA